MPNCRPWQRWGALVALTCIGLARPVAAPAQGKSQAEAGPRLAEVARFKTSITNFEEVLVAPAGDVVVVQDVLGTLQAWDVRMRKQLWEQQSDAYDHQLSADTEEVLWLDQSQAARDIVHTDLRTGKVRKRTTLAIERVKLWNAMFGKAPMLAAQAEYQDRGQVVTFSVATGKLLSRCDMPKGDDGAEVAIQGLGVSPDGARMLITMKGGVLLCEAAGKVLHRYRTANHVSRLLFLPDGRQAIACGDAFGTPVYLLDLSNGKVASREEHRWGTVSLDVSTDGKWAVSGGQCRFAADQNYFFRTKTSEGGEVVLWDLVASKPVVKLNPCLDSVKGVGLSPDGHWLVAAETGDSEGQLIVFERIGP